jgi:hypothetical protein
MITVGCEPPKTQAAQRNFFLQDVAAFEKANPDVTVTGDDTNPCDDPTTFDAKLASGKMDNVFYTYFTDAANVISSGQAADISKYAGQVKNLSSIQPDLVNLYRQGGAAGGDLYGVPVSNYTLGLLYNTTLFKRAGLDPTQPPHYRRHFDIRGGERLEGLPVAAARAERAVRPDDQYRPLPSQQRNSGGRLYRGAGDRVRPHDRFLPYLPAEHHGGADRRRRQGLMWASADAGQC